MGLFGGGGNKANKAAEQAAKDIGFAPKGFEIGGIGDVGVKRVGDSFTLNPTLDPRVAGLQEMLFAGGTPALEGAGAGVDPLGRASVAAAENAARAQGAFGSFDPLEAAREQFNQIDSLLAPGRERETAGLEARLFRQGRLDSTAGNNLMAERAAQIERERGLLAANQFQAAQQAQGNLAQTGSTLANTGAGLSEGLFNRGVASGTSGQALSMPLMQALGLASNIGQNQTSAQIAKSGAINQFNAGQDTGGGFGDLAGGLLTGAASSFLGPAAGSLATNLFGPE